MNTRQIDLSVVAMTGLLMVQPLKAADLPVKAPPVLYVDSGWSGFYFGTQIGGFVSGGRNRTFTSGDGGPVAVNGSGGVGGRTGNVLGQVAAPTVFYGAHGGYNWQFGNAVFGVEGDVDARGQTSDLQASARGRLGYAAGRMLFYGTGGYAYQYFNGGILGNFVGGNGGNGGNAGNGGDGGTGGNGFGALTIGQGNITRSGYVAGFGTEVKLTSQVGVGVEALYYNLHGGDLNNPGLGNTFGTVNGRLTFHTGGPSAPTSGFGSWAGVYGGGHIGAVYDVSTSVIDDVALANGQNGGAGNRGIDGGGGGGGGVAFASRQRDASFIGGVHIGSNWQSVSLVYGLEGDIDFSPDQSRTFLGSVRGRLGWASESYLLYGTGGVAFDRNEAVRAIFAGNGGNGGANILASGGAGGLALGLRADDTRVGFVAGAGLEAKINNRMSLGFEGLYYGFNGGALPAIPTGGRAFLSSAKDDAVVFRTRFSYNPQP